MKKPYYDSAFQLQKRREKRTLKRRRNRRPFTTTGKKEELFRIKKDRQIIQRFSTPLLRFFDGRHFFDGITFQTTVKVTNDFSLTTSYRYTLGIIKTVTRSFFELKGTEIVLDFSECRSAELPALFFLQIVRIEFQDALKALRRKLQILDVESRLKVVPSKVNSVNRLLLASGLIPRAELSENEMVPISVMGYLKGEKSRKHYLENKKGTVATSIVKYIDSCLDSHKCALSANGRNNLEGIISEVLNNAEDHSPFNTWYAAAAFFQELKSASSPPVGEVDMVFLNFGYSIYEGFEETKSQNGVVYNQMDALQKQVTGNGSYKRFSKEELFTLYALQEGFSRLKFENPSRGTGTINFINSFLNIGDYEDSGKGYVPRLTILSGNTQLICDNKYKPYTDKGRYYVSLNKQNDLKRPPEKTHLFSLDASFPGTLLSVKIFLNEDHINSKAR